MAKFIQTKMEDVKCFICAEEYTIGSDDEECPNCDTPYGMGKELSSLRERLKEAEARCERMREALLEIKNGRQPQVCAEYELCTHVGCSASYEAFAIADKALAGKELKT